MSAQSGAAAAANRKRMSRTIAATIAVFLVCFAGAPLAVAGEQARPAEPVRLAQAASQNVGQRVYEKWCAPCHAPGPDHPGTTALAALYKGGKPAALVERTDLTAPIVKQFVRHGVSVMPFFRKTEISDAELDALAAFLSKGRRLKFHWQPPNDCGCLRFFLTRAWCGPGRRKVSIPPDTRRILAARSDASRSISAREPAFTTEEAT